jgi:nuclear GTP-binding protein
MACSNTSTTQTLNKLQSVQLKCGLRIVDLPGVIFEDDDSFPGQESSAVLLRNVVKPENVGDSISLSGGASSLLLFAISSQDCHQFEEILVLVRTQTERSMKIYDLPTFSSTVEILTMLVLKYRTPPQSPSLLQISKNHFFPAGWHPDILSARHALIDWNHQKMPFFSGPPIYPRQSPVVAGTSHQAPRQRAKHRL